MTTADISLGRCNVGDTVRLSFTITRDGVPWDLTHGGATLKMVAPGRSLTRAVALAADNAALGVFHYDTTAADLTAVGIWQLGVTATDGAITQTYPWDITLDVRSEP